MRGFEVYHIDASVTPPKRTLTFTGDRRRARRWARRTGLRFSADGPVREFGCQRYWVFRSELPMAQPDTDEHGGVE